MLHKDELSGALEGLSSRLFVACLAEGRVPITFNSQKCVPLSAVRLLLNLVSQFYLKTGVYVCE